MARRGAPGSRLFLQCLLFWGAPVSYLTATIVRAAGTHPHEPDLLSRIAPTLLLLVAASAIGLLAGCCLRRAYAAAALLQLAAQGGALLLPLGGPAQLVVPKIAAAAAGALPGLATEALPPALSPVLGPRAAPSPAPSAAPGPIAAPGSAAVAAVAEGSEPDKISVVLPCLNESGFAIKTASRFCERTPEDILHEIVVVDDGSSPPLAEKFAQASIPERCRLRVLKHSKPYGLMIAKQTGGDAATGRYIGFFDCHVAPAKHWYKEIISLLSAQPKRLVVPMIGDIDVDTWDERKHGALTAKCYINFNADFWWYDDDSDYIPVISGGLVATTRYWWRASGGFDGGMRGWGGENTDQSLRAWLCGGDIMRAKSSKIAHMWRVQSDKRTLARYHFKGQTDNLARVAAIWFGEFKSKFRSGSLDSSIDVSIPLQRSRDMQCKPFVYFLHRFRKIYRDGGLLPEKVFKIRARGRTDKDACISRRHDSSFGLGECVHATWFHFANMAPPGFPVTVGDKMPPSGTEADEPDGATGATKMVKCGNHEARNCAECPQGNGGSWCHKDCVWNFGQCISKSAFERLKKLRPKKQKCCSGIREWNSLDCFDRPDPTGPIAYQCDVTGSIENQQYVLDASGHIRHATGKCVSIGKLKKRLAMTDCGPSATAWEQVDTFFPEETKLYRELVAKYGLTEDMPDH